MLSIQIFTRILAGKKYVGAAGIFYALLLPAFAIAGTTTVIFNPYSVSAGPFPSNAVAKFDLLSPTGLRINLNLSDEDSCDPHGHADVCSNAALLNKLDGFNINPRVMACFSGAIDPNSIASGIFIVPVTNTAATISLNQIVYDPRSHCAYGKPDHVLQQRSTYLLLVTDGLKDQAGQSVKDDGNYRNCLRGGSLYCFSLAVATQGLSRHASKVKVVAASLFTTMSATSWLELAQDAVQLFPSTLLPAGARSVFDLASVKSLTWLPDTAPVPSQDIPLAPLTNVGKVGFGLFLSPNYLNVSGPDAGTITGSPLTPVPVPGAGPEGSLGFVPISFHVYLPAGAPPPGGWPVVIYGHGLGDNQFGAPTFIASTLASHGLATLAMEITGHGFGPNGSVLVTPVSGPPVTVASPGRGILLGLPPIGPEDGCIVPGALAIRDCGRQTVVDLMALVKAIRQSDALGLHLDGNRIFYVGQSFGSIYGALLQAVEPSIGSAVLNSGGGTFTDIARLALTGRPLAGAFLQSVGLINEPPAPSAGCTADCFNDEYPFRDQPPLVSQVPGAIEIQAAFEAAEWLGMLGDPLAFGPHFKTDPLPGVPAKNTLFQFGLGDLEVPNPTESALIRAAAGQDSTWYFRFDRALAVDSSLLLLNYPGVPYPILPHRILSNPTIFSEQTEMAISLAEQGQVASFFVANGRLIADPNTFLPPGLSGLKLFEVPVVLPEMPNFLIPVP